MGKRHLLSKTEINHDRASSLSVRCAQLQRIVTMIVTMYCYNPSAYVALNFGSAKRGDDPDDRH